MGIGKLWLCMSVGLLLGGCQHYSSKNAHAQQQAPLPRHKHLELTAVDSLQIVGPIEVEIVSNRNRSTLDVDGDPALLQQLVIDNTGSELLLRLEPDSTIPRTESLIRARLSVQELHTLSYRGTGGLTATGLTSPMLNANINSQGPVRLSGKMGLTKLTLAGSGPVNISGVNSNDLTINARGNHWIEITGVANLRKIVATEKAMVSLYWVGAQRTTLETHNSAFVQVAGETHTLEINAYDKSSVQAAYLRAEHTYTKAWQHAKVDLHALKGQHSVASGEARIYTHSHPRMENEFLSQSGAVLPLKRWV